MPTLRPDDVAIMNNQSAHKGEAVRSAIAAAATRRLLLPPFSPDLNPIENASATSKATLPKAPAWTIDDLISAIRYVLLAFPPGKCANYFTAFGYKPE